MLSGPGSGQVAAIDQASIAAGAAGNVQLQGVLSDLGNTLTSLESAASGALFQEAQIDLGNLNELLEADPALASFATPLQPIVTAAGNDDLDGMLSNATSLFDSITAVLTQEADESFTATLSPSQVDLQPGQGQTLTLQLTDTGSHPENLNLSMGTLPSGVTVQLGQDTVSLAAGTSTSVDVTLSQTLQSSTVFTLEVSAAATVVTRTAAAVVSIEPTVADVLSVTPSPSNSRCRRSRDGHRRRLQRRQRHPPASSSTAGARPVGKRRVDPAPRAIPGCAGRHVEHGVPGTDRHDQSGRGGL